MWVIISFVWSFSALLIAYFSYFFLKPHHGRPYPPELYIVHKSFFDSFMHWDAVWYVKIALEGYTYHHFKHLPTVAFFPAYPIIIKILYAIFDVFYSPIYILPAFLFQILSIYILYLLSKEIFEEENIISFVLTAYAFYPASFFAFSAYPTSLLNLCAILSMYFAHKNKFFQSSFFAGLGSLSGPLGSFLVILTAFYYIKDIKNIKKAIEFIPFFIISIWGFIAFSIYCYSAFKDPFAFIHAQEYWGKPSLDERFKNIFKMLFSIFFNFKFDPVGFDHFLNDILIYIFLGFLIFSFRKINFGWWIFSLLIFLNYIWHLGSIFISSSAFARLSYIDIPFFLFLGILYKKHPFIAYSLLSIFFIIFFILESLFVKNYWSI